MKNRFTLALTAGATLLLCHCGDPCTPPEPGSFGAFADGLAGAFVNHATGVPLSSLPNSACVEDPPIFDEQALGAGAGAACGAASGDDACATCAKTSCCDVSLACWKENTCTCLVACQTVGCSSAESAPCGEPDPAFAAVRACVADHCAKQCPSF
jgi:hypothetical protein